MAEEPTDSFKVDKVKYPNLRDVDVQVYQDGQNIRAIHVPSGISVDADTRHSAAENWELAQMALSQGVEHHDASWSNPEPGPRPEF